VWRADRPQHGRFQEFYQCDADIVGDRSLWQEVEVLALYDRAFTDLKIEGVHLKINHRKILAGIVSKLGAKERLSDFTVTLDKIDKIGKEGVFKELVAKEFSEDAIEFLDKLLSIAGSNSKQLATLRDILSGEPEGLEGIEELEFILEHLKNTSLSTVLLDFDLTLARGLHYYTGMIVEVSAPKTVKMGSIGGGGRYDDLTSAFGLKNMSGIGVSFGFERIFLVMEALNLFPKELLITTEVLFANFGLEAATIAYSCVSMLRKQNVSCELYPTEAKLKKQLGYANQKNIQKVVLIGEEEVSQQTFILKDMESGKQSSHPIKKLTTIFS
jgi:histidyl-tRNA synthetase